MNIIYCEKVKKENLQEGSTAEAYLFCIEVTDIKANAKTLIDGISDTSWMSKLDSVGKMTFKKTTDRTIEKLVEIFKKVNNKITEDFGEYMISMNSGYCLRDKQNHEILPISELWKPKISGNEGFDFHTVSPNDRFSFGEAKYVSSGNAYGKAAEQVCKFIDEGKDCGDAGLLNYFNKPIAINNLQDGKRGFVVSFSINSSDHETILKNSLENNDIKKLLKSCDELYIIGVKNEAN